MANSGIQLNGGGSFAATNVAVGENAAVTVGGDAQGSTVRAAEDLRRLAAEAGDAEAARAAETVVEEAAKPAPDKAKARDALGVIERVCKAGGALAGFAEKAAPLVARLAVAFA